MGFHDEVLFGSIRHVGKMGMAGQGLKIRRYKIKTKTRRSRWTVGSTVEVIHAIYVGGNPYSKK